MHWFAVRVSLFVIVASPISGCAGAGSDAVPAFSSSLGSLGTSYMSAGVKGARAQLVYLSAFVAGTVYVYDQQGNGQTPIGQIGGLSAPNGIAVTARGDLYVASQSKGTVSAFHRGDTVPFKVFTGGSSLRGVAVDGNGTVYANNGFSNQIFVWANGSKTPTTILTPAFSENCDYVAVDAQNDLFVDSIFGEFDEFPAGSNTPVKLFKYGFHNAPNGLILDAKQDLITSYADGTIAVYPKPYDGTTSATFTHSGLIYAIALSKSEKTLWAGNMTGPGGTVGQSYSFPGGTLLGSTSSVDIADDTIFGVATYPPAKN